MAGSCQTAVGLGWQKSKSCSGVVSARGVFFGVGRDGAIAEWKQSPPPHPCPVNLPRPQVCCPLDRTAFKIGLRLWCSWGGKCCGGGRWCPSRAASSLGWVLWVRGWRGCAKVSPDPSVPGVSPLFPHFTFFFFFSLPWRHWLKTGKSSLKWLFSCKPF